MRTQMKDSGIEWIGSIPGRWVGGRIKDCGLFKPGVDYQNLQAGNIPVFGSSSVPFGFVDKALSKKKAIAIGRKGTIDKPYIINQPFWAMDTCLFNTVNNKRFNFVFVYYWMNIVPWISFSSKTALPSLTQKQVNNILFFYPNYNEQSIIANYLDKETSKIDEQIELIKKKVTLLDEYKQSLIYECVTKGLDKNVEMKDSGIEWIGMIPKHWEIKRLIKEVDYANLPKAIEGSTNYLEIGDVDVYKNSYSIEGKEKLSVIGARMANKKTLLISTVRPNRGGITITKYKHPVSSAFCAIKNPSKYWFYFIKNKGFLNELVKMNMDTTYPTCKDIDIIKQIVCVPNKNEQQQIVDYLDEQCLILDKKKELIIKKIELLSEYKQSLIYECVTGKINVGKINE